MEQQQALTFWSKSLKVHQSNFLLSVVTILLKDSCSPDLQVTWYETIIRLGNCWIVAVLILLQEMRVCLHITSTEDNCFTSNMKRQYSNLYSSLKRSVLNASVCLIHLFKPEQRHPNTCLPMLGPEPGIRHLKGGFINTPPPIPRTLCFCVGR